MTDRLPWRAGPDGIELAVRLTPRGGRDGVIGISTDGAQACLALRVAAPPVEGAANAALIGYLAKALGLPKSRITLLSGEQGRIKRLLLQGEDVADRLARLVAEP